MKIKSTIYYDNSFIWYCVRNRKFKELKTSLFRFNKPDNRFNGYFIYIYPVCIYIFKEKI